MAPVGATVELYESVRGLIGTGVADSSGVWVVDYSDVELEDGVYEFFARTIDLAGNVSPDSTPLNVTIDTSSPIDPTIDLISADSGRNDSDGVTNDATLVFKGTGESGTQIELFESTLGSLGVVSVPGNGTWELDVTDMPIADGVYQVTAVSTDTAGNHSESDLFSVIVDTETPFTPTVTGLDSDTRFADGVTSDTTLTFFGTSEPLTRVEIYETSAGFLGETFADPNGEWNFDWLETLDDGFYQIQVLAEDLAGNRTVLSESFDVLVDTNPPTTPTLDLDSADDSAPQGDQTTSIQNVTLVGTTTPNTEVKLLETGQTGTSDSAGDFSFEKC